MKRKLNASKSIAESNVTTVANRVDLHENFRKQLKAVFDGEKNLNNALPNLSAAATHEELKAAYHTHLQETKNQVQRLLHVFELLGKKVMATKHSLQEGLHTNLGSPNNFQPFGERELALAACNQQPASFDINSYGSLKAVAGIADMKECHGI